MKDTLKFLSDLSWNNNKEWFDANKGRYLEAKSKVETLTADVLAGIHSFDDTIRALSPKDCTYRIYRDQRFSKDKTPYKTHMGVYINRGGKKSGYSGYYFHLGAKSYGNMVAVGDIWCPPEVLKVIREDIMLGGGDFWKILSEVDTRLVLDMNGALKRVPSGFPAEAPSPSWTISTAPLTTAAKRKGSTLAAWTIDNKRPVCPKRKPEKSVNANCSAFPLAKRWNEPA